MRLRKAISSKIVTVAIVIVIIIALLSAQPETRGNLVSDQTTAILTTEVWTSITLAANPDPRTTTYSLGQQITVHGTLTGAPTGSASAPLANMLVYVRGSWGWETTLQTDSKGRFQSQVRLPTTSGLYTIDVSFPNRLGSSYTYSCPQNTCMEPTTASVNVHVGSVQGVSQPGAPQPIEMIGDFWQWLVCFIKTWLFGHC